MNLSPALQRMLDALADGQWHRGADLAHRLGVSRDAVWIAVERLRDAGVVIEGHCSGPQSMGYRLVAQARAA